MAFTRHLDKTFIAALNKLYEDERSWWRKLVDDDDVFIAIRNNAINAYAQGASIARVEWKDGMRLNVHRKFLVVPKTTKGDEYVDLLDANRERSEAVVVNSPTEYTDHFAQIKAAAGRLTGAERQGENEIALACDCVLDIEAMFDTNSRGEDGEDETSEGRVDIVSLTDDDKITLTEAKLYKNSEIRARKRPAVCDQLEAYFNWAKSNHSAILAAYAEVIASREALHIRSSTRTPADLDPTPRLLIFGFDRPQRGQLGAFADKIIDELKGAIPGFTKDHIRAVGDASKVTLRHLR